MIKRNRRPPSFENIEFPPIPAALFEHAGKAARRALKTLPSILPVDSIVLVGNALSHGQLYRLHPVGTNLNTALLAMLDLAGIAITVLGSPFLALSAGFRRHQLNWTPGYDYEPLWEDVLLNHRRWLSSIYHPALARGQSGQPLSIRETEILWQMQVIRQGSLIRMSESKRDHKAVRTVLANLADPSRVVPENRFVPKEAQQESTLAGWYLTLRKMPQWDLEDLMLVNEDHTVAFDTRLPTAAGRGKGSGLRGLASLLADKNPSDREKAIPEALEAAVSPLPDPTVAAAAAELARTVRDLREAALELPLMDEVLDWVQAGVGTSESGQLLRFAHAVVMQTVRLKDRALQGAILYELGRDEWARQTVAAAYGTTPDQLRHRQGRAQALLVKCRQAAAA